MRRSIQLGRVTAFDYRRGLGILLASNGQEIGFHCTAIVDGSRDIAVDTSVAFRVVPSGGGDWEAVELTPCST